MTPLDFLIIGAQKCATTTLFELLRQHPSIALPLEKEVPFFTDPEASTSTWESFCRQQFAGRAGRQLLGKATPQYMADRGVPARIKRLMPDIKLVAVLREPVARSRSHYRMSVRRGTEAETYAAAVTRLLRPDAQARGRGLPPPQHRRGYESESDFYLAWSEYGRIIDGYLQHFPADQLLVLYTQELEANPGATLDRLLVFLGLEAGFRPPLLGKKVHAGGGATRVPQGVRVWLRNRAPLYRTWELIPEAYRGRLRFLYEQWNVRAGAPEPDLEPALEDSLRTHFAADVEHLLSLPVRSPPWAANYLPAKPEIPAVGENTARILRMSPSHCANQNASASAHRRPTAF